MIASFLHLNIFLLSFQVLFVPEEDIQHVNWEGNNGGRKQGRWGLTLILSVGEGGLKLSFA